MVVEGFRSSEGCRGCMITASEVSKKPGAVQYFSLDEDIAAIRADLADRDQNLARSMEKYPYLRVLRQPEPPRVSWRLRSLRSGRLRAA